MKYTEEELHINEKMVLRVSAMERRKKILEETEISGKGKHIQLCSFTAFLNSFKLMKINLELSS